MGDTVLFTAIPCPLHDFVKFNLNANDVQAITGSGKFTYSYVVKAEDTELNMKAFMTESEKRITKIERVGDEKNLTLFANDEKNESAAQLKAFVNNQIVLKATYNDGEEKTSAAGSGQNPDAGGRQRGGDCARPPAAGGNTALAASKETARTMQVKASGGMHVWEDAKANIEAGIEVLQKFPIKSIWCFTIMTVWILTNWMRASFPFCTAR